MPPALLLVLCSCWLSYLPAVKSYDKVASTLRHNRPSQCSAHICVGYRLPRSWLQPCRRFASCLVHHASLTQTLAILCIGWNAGRSIACPFRPVTLGLAFSHSTAAILGGANHGDRYVTRARVPPGNEHAVMLAVCVRHVCSLMKSHDHTHAKTNLCVLTWLAAVLLAAGPSMRKALPLPLSTWCTFIWAKL